jgi:hypothetical protein
MASPGHALKTTGMRVVVVKTDDVASYLQWLEKGKGIMNALGITGSVRVWRATFAGPNAGNIIVAIEFPDLSAFADAETKIRGDKNYQAWLGEMAKSRTIISDSLYTEL